MKHGATADPKRDGQAACAQEGISWKLGAGNVGASPIERQRKARKASDELTGDSRRQCEPTPAHRHAARLRGCRAPLLLGPLKFKEIPRAVTRPFFSF
jgi:hypothetical protein